MATVTICSDFGSQKIKSVTVSTVSPSICHEVMGTLSIMMLQIFHDGPNCQCNVTCNTDTWGNAYNKLSLSNAIPTQHILMRQLNSASGPL